MSALVALAVRPRRTGLVLAVAGLALVVALVLVGGRPGPAGATGTMPPTLTFEGDAGGGTIRITTTADRSEIVAAAVEDVFFTFPGCDLESTDGASGSAYMGPPAPVADGDFAFDFSFIDLSGASAFIFSGSFAGENTIEGTTTGAFFVFPLGLSCESAPVPWTLTGPTETSPGPDDQSFIGSAGGGSFTIVTDPSGTQITALVLESVFFDPGYGVIPSCGRITAIVPLMPPVLISPVDSSFEISFSVGRGLSISVSGTLDGQAAAGTLFVGSLPCAGGSAEWAATLKPTNGPPTATGTVLPACTVWDLSDSWDMKTQHGTGTEGHFDFSLNLVQTNSSLSGTMVDGSQITSVSGTLEGKTVTFGRLIDVGGPTERTQTYSGLLTPEGTTMAGTFNDPRFPPDGIWVATRSEAHCGEPPPPTPEPPVGGIGVEPDLGALALETPDESGGNAGVLAGIAVAIAAGAVALGAAWYTRRRAIR